MRVIAGSAKGRPLVSPRGSATRPTSDMVRGAMFDMLDAAGADYESVLDLYAGSGALGIEALSRGGGSCVFVERDPRACDIIRRNLKAAGVAASARVLCTPVRRGLSLPQGPYTLVVADPPYADDDALDALGELADRGTLAAGGLLVIEHSKRREMPGTLGSLVRLRERRHGDTVVTVYGRDDRN